MRSQLAFFQTMFGGRLNEVTKLSRISRWNAMAAMHDNVDIFGRLWVSLSYSYQHSNCAELDPPRADTFVAALKFKKDEVR